MKKTAACVTLNILVVVGIVLTIMALVGTPLVLTAFFKASEFNPTNDWAVEIATGCIYLIAAPVVAALFILRSICRCLGGEEAFSEKIARRLRGIAICSFAEIAVFLAVTLVLYFAFDVFMYALTVLPAFVVTFVCLTLGFLMLVLANVFHRAGEMKEENESIF